MEKNKLGLGVLVLVGVLLVIAVFNVSSSVSSSLASIADVIKNKVTETLGATPGDTLNGNCWTVGGQTQCRISSSFTATSSTLCAVKNPVNATTTIDKVTTQRTSGFVAASTFDISTSTTAYASSTPALVYARQVAAGSLSSTVWVPRQGTSTTNLPLFDTLFWNNQKDITYGYPFLLGPNEWVTVRVATGTPGSETIRGTCGFEFTKL